MAPLPPESSGELRSPAPPRPLAWMGFAIYAALLIAYHVVDANLWSLVRTAIGGLGFVPLNMGAIYWLWRASGNPALAPGARAGLWGLGAMFALTLVGNLGYAFESLVRRHDPMFGWTNVPYLLTYPVGAFALSRFPNRSAGRSAGRDQLIDLACLVVAAGALVWTFIIAPVNLQLDWVPLAITLAYPLAAVLLLTFVWRLLLVEAATPQHQEFALLGAALFVQCVADLVLELDFDDTTSLTSIWSAVVAPMTYVLIVFAAQRAAARPVSESPMPATTAPTAATLLPIMAAIAVYAALIWAAESGHRAPLGPLVVAAIALNVLFLVKQAGAAAENGRLIAARAELESRARFETLALEGQKLEAVGLLAGGVAHDFNNLLTTVLANAELALLRLRPGDAAHEEVTDIRGAALRGAELVRQLLAFSRKSVIEPVLVSPGTVVRDMERLLQRLAGERHGLLFELAPDLGTVRIDRGQLEQALANLVSNARDAMPDGGAIVITGRNARLDAAAATLLGVPPGSYVSVAVQDSGAGIAPDVRQHIFEPFFSTKARGKGTGLGLASTYGIVRQSQGAIDVQSEPGQGACFTLYLPRVDAGPVGTTVPGEFVAGGTPAAHDVRGRTILLVEDDPAVRQVTRRVLAGAGYAVLTAADAVAARALFEQHGDDITLLLTDVMMPGDTGLALASQLRRRRPDLPVLFMSGYSDGELPALDGASAAGEFLPKPFAPGRLLERLDVLLREPSLRR